MRARGRVRAAGPQSASADAAGAIEELARWKMPVDTMTNVSVEDGEGVVKSFERSAGMLDVGAPRTTVALVYDLKPVATDDESLRTVVEAARFRGTGEHVLALPLAFDTQRIEATVVIDAHANDVPMTASSYGVGGSRIRNVVRTTGAALRRIAFFGGAGGHAVFAASMRGARPRRPGSATETCSSRRRTRSIRPSR